MPLYEFFCTACQESFSAFMHVSEHDDHVAECPKCGRKDHVERRMSSFTAVTSHKSTSP